MNRILAAAIAAALALPLLALSALIVKQETMLSGATVVNVPVRGYDPRDLIHGHYIQGQLDWEWENEPKAATAYSGVDGGACVVKKEAPKPRLRFIAGWKAGDHVAADCLMMIAGRGWSGQGGLAARFVPAALDAGGGQVRLFVPERRAADLEQLLIERPGAFTVDLAVRPDGSAAIKALRVDGGILGH